MCDCFIINKLSYTTKHSIIHSFTFRFRFRLWVGLWGNILSYMVIRDKEILVWQKIGVDKETYDTLRKQKKKQHKSMMRIVKDLIKKEYA